MEDSVNPCPPDDLDKGDSSLLRGDAIGDTAYTHRWVLQSLCTITEALPKYLKSLKQSSHQEKTESHENTNIISDQEEIPDDSSDLNIMELDSKVEDAACQLWDMTVEKSVTEHLLELEEVDILQLAVLVFQESLSPRLTEVLIGIIANMCCQEKACEKILGKKENNELLLSTVHLLGESSDVPTICEALRFMKLLLWHRTNRTPNTTWASCPLVKLLCQDFSRCSLSFLINNSLSDMLITNLLELLSSFLFVCLPETGLNVASLFSVKEIIDGFLEILKRKVELIGSNLDDDQSEIIHSVIICLYAFINTPGARLIIKEVQNPDCSFESNLQQCLELRGHVESYHDLVGETAERLCQIIGLYQLIIPHLKVATSLITIGRVLALICGQTHQYCVSRTTGGTDSLKKGRSNSAEDTLVETSLRPPKERRHSSSASSSRTHRQFSNPPVDEGGWLSPLKPCSLVTDSPATASEVRECDENEAVVEKRADSQPHEPSDDDTTITQLKEVIEDYCYQLLACHWTLPECEERKKFQTEIFDILNQCHAHEVLFILKAVRSKDPGLVSRLQEQLLDKGSHHRLVALLAFMYQ